MSEDRTRQVIARLVEGLEPRRPLRPPRQRAVLWLAGAATFMLLLVWFNGPRPDLAQHFSAPTAILEWLAMVATAITAAVAAFHLALPDRDARWGLLPLPSALVWFASLGYGCFSDWMAYGRDGLAIGTSPHCLKFITFASVPLILSLLVMLRHAATIRPNATAAAAALAAAALASAGLTLFHDLDSSIMILIWHGVPLTLIVLAGGMLGRPVLTALARA